MSASSAQREPLAVVGLDGIFPGSTDATGFWRDILQGNDQLRDVPATHWHIDDYYDPDPSTPDKTYARRGAFIDAVELDPASWGIPPKTVEATDTAQLLALIVAQRVLADATAGQFKDMDRSRVSVILGVTGGQELLGSMVARLQEPVWTKAMREAGLGEDEVQDAVRRILEHYVPWQESTFPGLLGNVVAGRIANKLDLGGTNCITDAACASSISALSMAANELYLGDSDLVITGGVDTMNDAFMYMCFSKTPALSPSGDCRPFSAEADGTMLGEGIGMLALKRLSDAERDGDRVYALVRGIGSSSDGSGTAVYAPRPSGQAQALRRAYGHAGYGPESVELMEAHGTGTKAGDAAELTGLCEVFGEARSQAGTDGAWCSLGSVKSLIGHTKAAAGAGGLIKAVLAIHARSLPAMPKVDAPSPKLDGSPFAIDAATRPWVRGPGHERRAGVSSFGFGGSNFHVTLSDPPASVARAQRLRSTDAELVLLGGTAAQVAAGARAHAAAASDHAGYLAWVSHQTCTTWDSASATRLAVVASDEAELVTRLLAAAERVEAGQDFALPGVHFASSAPSGDVAFLFPGQGSQHLQMGSALALTFESSLAAWDLAAGLDLEEQLHDVVFPPKAFDDAANGALDERLRATEWAQPALGAASLATLAVLRDLGVEPAMLGGHSFGEVVALHAAGAFDASTMLRVARKRGELMRDAATVPGAMLAVSARRDAVEALLGEAGGDVVVANHNAPEQVVVSGTVQGIEAVAARCSEQGLNATRLPVATAFHSPIVEPAAAGLRTYLDDLPTAALQVPVYANTTAAPYGADAGPAEVLAQQIASPVRFVEMVERMYADGARVFVEAGPGRILTGLVSSILGDREHRAINLDRRGGGLPALLDGVGRLTVAGVAMDPSSLWAGYRVPQDPRDRPKPKLSLQISGVNHGRPYPCDGPKGVMPAPNPPRAALAAPAATAPAATAPAATAPAATSAAAAAPATSAAAAPLPATAAGGTNGRATMPAVPVPAAPAASAAMPAPAPEAPRPAAPAPAPVSASVHQRAGEVHVAAIEAIARLHAKYLDGYALAAGGAVPAPMAPAVTPAFAEPAPLALPEPVTAPAAPVAAEPAPAVPAAALAPLPAAQVAVTGNGHGPAVVAAPAAPAVDLTVVMLEVVAEKTGYPVEMLELSMEMEADLGIDSIKRVEILSGMRDRVPDLPEVDTAELAQLATLQEVVDHMGRGMVVAPVAPAAAPAAPAVDLTVVMLEVVAEKTGYPVEMLELSMEMEADLGIDSIKRVEILSGMRDRVPDLPEVDTAELAQLATLQEVVDHMGRGSSAAPAEPVAAVEPTVAATDATPVDLVRCAARAVPAPARGLAVPGLLGGRIAVTDDGGGIAAALVALLVAHGFTAERVTEVPADAVGVVLCHRLGATAPDSCVDDAVSAFTALQPVAARFAADGGLLVTVQDTGGSFGLGPIDGDRAWAGGLAGLARTAAREWPACAVKAIDVAHAGRTPAEVAAALADELLVGGPELEVGLPADGSRLRLVDVAAEPTGTCTLGAQDVVVVSGGGRGVTAACAIELAAQTQARLVLLGRTSLDAATAVSAAAVTDREVKAELLQAAKAVGEQLSPADLGRRAAGVLAAREVQGTVDAIVTAGGQAGYVEADIADAAEVAAALAEVRQEWGPITAVVHGAGVLADRSLVEKTEDQVRRVLGPKVDGLRALLAATASDPLRVLCAFSSVAARHGNAGQSDYAAANQLLGEVLSAERARRGGDVVVRAIGWGPWDGGMVDADLREHFTRRGIAMVPLQAGARAFVAELGDAGDDVQITIAAGAAEALAGLDDGLGSRAEVLVSSRTHPQFADHAVRGTVVVPLACSLDWIARAAAAFWPGRTVASLEDVRVTGGIKLAEFTPEAVAITIRGSGDDDGARVELAGPDGRVGVRCCVTFGTPPEVSVAVVEVPSTDGVEPYAGTSLFHGPAFRVIDHVVGYDVGGMRAALHGAGTMGWPAEAWSTDPAILDGALQLVLLWGEHSADAPAALPTSIGSVRMHRGGAIDGAVSCSLHVTETTDVRATGDIVVHDAEGRPVLELLAVEGHVLPALA